VEAVKQGQPAVIFEDPFPLVMPQPWHAQEKPPQGGMFGMGGAPQQKGDIRALWNALEIQVTGTRGSYATFRARWSGRITTPIRVFRRGIGPELVFIRRDMPENKEAFNPESPVVSNFEEVLFPYPTGISQRWGQAQDDRVGPHERRPQRHHRCPTSSAR